MRKNMGLKYTCVVVLVWGLLAGCSISVPKNDLGAHQVDQAEQGGREFLARQPLQVPPSMSDSLADDRIELATLRAIDHPVDDQYEAQNEEIILAQSSGEAAAADAGPPASAEDDLAALAQKTNNPISDAWLLITQNDTTIIDGDAIDTEVVNSLKFQPVLSVPVFEGDWNFVVRPVLQFQSLPFDDDVGDLLGASLNDIVSDPDLAALAADPDGRTNGLGDSVLLTLLGPNTDDGWIYAGGLTQILPTASEDVLGQEKWQAGPAALVVRLGKDYGGFSVEDFNAGFLAQQWWSYAGDDDRDSTNQMDIQYFVNWKATPTQLIGMTPNISINWDADGGFFENKMAFPIGLGTIGLFKVGKLPIRYGLEAQYYLTGPDAVEREANFRFFIAPIIPNLLKAS